MARIKIQIVSIFAHKQTLVRQERLCIFFHQICFYFREKRTFRFSILFLSSRDELSLLKHLKSTKTTLMKVAMIQVKNRAIPQLKYFFCSEEGCIKSYQRHSSLQKHLECGRYKYVLEYETLFDRAVPQLLDTESTRYRLQLLLKWDRP